MQLGIKYHGIIRIEPVLDDDYYYCVEWINKPDKTTRRTIVGSDAPTRMHDTPK